MSISSLESYYFAIIKFGRYSVLKSNTLLWHTIVTYWNRTPANRQDNAGHLSYFFSTYSFSRNWISKLADILADDTRNGAEILSHILNSFFSGLVDIVLSNGGDIIKFAGSISLFLYQRKRGKTVLIRNSHPA